MALRGNLRDFSLPDVFQLVQLSGKTGVLRIQGPEADGSIWFRDGEVFFAQSNWRREHLGERLVAAQRITPAALARALDLRASEPDGGRRLGEILVNEGYITPQVLETFVQEQIQDTIFDLMRWDEGDFDFEVLPDVVHEDIGLSVSVENIVMEGSRRLEEWQRIKKKVPSTDMVFKMATAPGEGTFEISLKPVEWALLLLIDGTRSVRELALQTHSTDFDVARVIYGLFSAGLLEVPTDDEIDRLRVDRARREEKRSQLEAHAPGPAAIPSPGTAAPAETSAAPQETVAPHTPAQELAPEPEPRHVPEEPEFLAGSGEAPSTDDMAVFEQMMASVLSPQAPEAEAVLEPLSEREPIVQPSDDLSADEIVSGLGFFPEPPVAPSIEVEPEAEPETPFVSYAPTFEPESVPEPEDVSAATVPAELDLSNLTIAELEALSDAATSVTEEPSAPPVVPRTGDFEADLRSLGLGELPEELLQSMAPAAPVAEPTAPIADAMEPPTEPRPPMSEIESGRAEQESAPPAEETDLDSLLASLGQGQDASAVIALETDARAEQTDAAGGYISTDAFLAEFDDPSLSGGLGDELTALTGGGSTTRSSRPVATVNKLPEVGEMPMLHRDQMVDRTLLEKIIEGIENL